MSSSWDLDFTGGTVKDADLGNAIMQDGWYLCTIVDVVDELESGAKVFWFEVANGPLKGRKFRQRLSNPRFLSDKGKEFANKLSNCWSSRLGLVDESANGKMVRVDFDHAKGKQVVLKLTKGKEDKNGRRWQEVGFDLYLPNNPAIQRPDILVACGLATGGAKDQQPGTSQSAGSHPAASNAPPPQPKAVDLWN